GAVAGRSRWWPLAPSAAAGVTGAVRPAPAARASVAVLPFVNGTGSGADDHLSDGLTDELIGALGRLPGLKVAGRTSAFALRGRGLSVRAVADTLGVANVLEGRWHRVGTRLVVSTQLVTASDGSVVWAERYERELTNVLDVQAEIARTIVGDVRTRLGGRRDVGGTVRSPTDDPAAYELYLRGRYAFHTRTTPDGVLQAADFFEQAVARDPSYARAHAGLSDAYTRLAVFGYAPAVDRLAAGKAAARRALALDSTLAEGHTALAHATLIADFDWAAAERGFRRATTLDPGYVFARAPFAICLASQGRFDEAIAQLDTAIAADPLAPSVATVLGRVLVSAGRPDDAIRVLRRVLALNPRMDLAHQQLGHAYLRKGLAAPAIAELRRAAALSGPRDSAQLAYGYAVTGRRAEARAIVRTLADPARRGAALPYHIAMAYAGLGEADAAFGWLERGYAERASFMVGAAVEPGFASLRTDPRWPRLLRSMGLAR
ncbi:MAG: Adenylate cyclase, partial [uncultured Gemmatimonadaceae bacterium]